MVRTIIVNCCLQHTMYSEECRLGSLVGVAVMAKRRKLQISLLSEMSSTIMLHSLELARSVSWSDVELQMITETLPSLVSAVLSF